MAVEYGSLSFEEQVKFFRDKQLVSSQRWNDLIREEHDTGFMVAGAMEADLLQDLYDAVQKSIEKGTTLKEFQRDFDRIVKQNGWTGWTGEETEKGRAWRTRVIYETNLNASYQAGRYQQLQASSLPYVQYIHSDLVDDPRLDHKSWNGLILPINDPWVKLHWPPNGWGCQCRFIGVSERKLRQLGKTAPDKAPQIEYYQWKDPKTKQVLEFPKGIDPYFDYSPGQKYNEIVRSQLLRKTEQLHPDLQPQYLERLNNPQLSELLLDSINDLSK